MTNNTEDVERIIASTYSNGSISDSLPGGLREKFKEEQVDKIMALIQQEANRQKADLLDELQTKAWVFDDTGSFLIGARVAAVPVPVIEAERNQLKEGKQ